METRKRFPAEVRERAVRLVFEQQANHPSQWAAIEPSLQQPLHRGEPVPEGAVHDRGATCQNNEANFLWRHEGPTVYAGIADGRWMPTARPTGGP